VTTASGRADEVAGYLRELMAGCGRTIGQAVQAVEAVRDRVTVRFPAVAEPGYHDVGDGHRVYCGRQPWCAGAGSATAGDAAR
jgi:hypothetical protein